MTEVVSIVTLHEYTKESENIYHAIKDKLSGKYFSKDGKFNAASAIDGNIRKFDSQEEAVLVVLEKGWGLES